MKKICFVSSPPFTLRWFMSNHMLKLAENYEITAVADFTEEDLACDSFPGIRLIPIPIARQIDMKADFRALVKLVMLFRSEHFNVVHSITPKAGLLATFGAKLTNVPHRIHCFTGQVWATQHGFKRNLLKFTDLIIANSANHVLVDSKSQLDFLEIEGILNKGQAQVIGAGSISGVDIKRFQPNIEIRTLKRLEWEIPPEAFILLFVGRLNRDKGIYDLAKAFMHLSDKHEEIWLVLVGQNETGKTEEDLKALFGKSISKVCRVGYMPDSAHAMNAADILVLPSYREGFGNVVIEAAACGIPAVASRIYGLTDAVEENVTGLLHPPGEVNCIIDCIERLYINKSLRLKMGQSAFARATAKFEMNTITNELVAYYSKILNYEIR